MSGQQDNPLLAVFRDMFSTPRWPQLQQQRTPHKCPKCDGKGWLRYHPAMPFSMAEEHEGAWRCDVCESGIIWSRL